MDDLQLLNELLIERDPSVALVNRGRERLRRAALAPVRHRPSAALIGGGLVGAAAAVAAAAVLVNTNPTPTSPISAGSRFASSHSAPTRMSGRQILLAAAVAAQARPTTTGTYWYVKTVTDVNATVTAPVLNVRESWTRRDGASWVREDATNGKPGTVYRQSGPGQFIVAGVGLTYARLQKLPTDPAALTAWLLHARGDLDPMDRGGAINSDLVSLLSDVPVGPAVRATAFRALAARPNVLNLGAVKGGRALQLPARGGSIRLVVDPATSVAHSTSYIVGSGKKSQVKGAIKVLRAGWTNVLPNVATSHK